MIDDVDGSIADETLQFAVDGVGYEIDLNADHAKALRESFAEWIADARKLGKVVIGGRTNLPAAGRAVSSADRQANQHIRDWARGKGIKVSDRGRIAADVLAAYRLEH